MLDAGSHAVGPSAESAVLAPDAERFLAPKLRWHKPRIVAGKDRADDAPFRVAPHNLEAEQALLGAILLDNQTFPRVAGFLDTSDFFDPAHAAIYQSATAMIKSGRLADPVTLRSHFESFEPIDAQQSVPQYLGWLAANAPTTLHAHDYGLTIRDLAIRRRLVLISEDIANAAYDGPVDFPPSEQLAEARTRLDAIESLCVDAPMSDLEFARDASAGAASVYVVKGLIPAAAVVVLWGATTAGKTFWLVDGCFRVALGKRFMGRRTRQGATLYVPLEGRSGFGKRLAAAAGHHGDPGNLFARLKSVVTLGRSSKAEADVTRIISAARALAKQADTHVALIVIDTLARALAGDNENEAGAISAVVAQANRIAAETGAAVLIAHHPGKDQERGMRGSYALAADVDVVIKIEREPGADVRDVVLEKSKDGEEGPVGSFTLERVILGQDDDADDITTCIVKYVEDARERRSKRPPLHTAAGKALIELDHLLIEGRGTPSRGHVRIPDGASLIKRADWQAACLAKGLSTGEAESEKRTFRRSIDQLSAQGFIGVFGEDVWPIRGADKKGLSGAHRSSTAADTAGQPARDEREVEKLQ